MAEYQIKVLACDLCGFRVTYDNVGVAAMQAHYFNDHKDVEFANWASMHTTWHTLKL